MLMRFGRRAIFQFRQTVIFLEQVLDIGQRFLDLQ